MQYEGGEPWGQTRCLKIKIYFQRETVVSCFTVLLFYCFSEAYMLNEDEYSIHRSLNIYSDQSRLGKGSCQGRVERPHALFCWCGGKITSSVAVLGNGVTNAAKFDAESVCRENVVRSN